jgi:hypothetical protein
MDPGLTQKYQTRQTIFVTDKHSISIVSDASKKSFVTSTIFDSLNPNRVKALMDKDQCDQIDRNSAVWLLFATAIFTFSAI